MLRILTRLAGPIFAKEMIEMARRRRYFFNRAFYGLVLLLVLFSIWRDQREFAGRSIRYHARMAEALFNGVVITQYAAVFLLVPLFLAGVVASEREERTLDLLLTTRLRDREIVLGKLASRMVVLAMLLFSGLPVLSLVLLLGGVDPVMLLRCTAATFLAILFVAAHAIYFSTITRSPIAALVRTFWWLAVLLIGLPIAVSLVLAGITEMAPVQVLQPDILVIAAGVGLVVNPIGSFLVATSPDEFRFLERALGEWSFPILFVVPTAWSALLIWRAVVRLRVDPTPVKLPSLGKLWRAFLETPEDSPRRCYGRPVANPLWQRARVARIFDREGIIGRIQWAAWAVALFFFLLVAMVEPRELKSEDCAMTFLGLTWVAVAALTVIFAGTSLVGDRRRGFLDQVLVTPLTGQQVIDGTLLAVGQHLLRVLWLPIVLGLMFLAAAVDSTAMYRGMRSSELGAFGMFGSWLTAFLVCGLFAVHGVACSLAARTFAGALVPAFVFPVMITIGAALLLQPFRGGNAGIVLASTGVVALGVGWLWVQRRPGPASVSLFFAGLHLSLACAATFWSWGLERDFAVAAVNPLYWTIVLLQRYAHRYPFNQTAWHTAMLCYWLALLASIVLMRGWLHRNFDGLVERVPENRPGPMPRNMSPEETSTGGSSAPAG